MKAATSANKKKNSLKRINFQIDERQMADWLKQAAALPGWTP